MKTPRIRTRTIAALLLAPTALHAADRFWIDPTGGFFTDITNWSLTSGGAGGAAIPVVPDVANFTLASTYTVIFNPATTNLGLDVDNGNVTFDLNGNTYTLTNSVGIDIAELAGQTGRLTVRGGILAMDTNGDDVSLGVDVGATGFLTIAGNGRVGDGTIRPDMLAGLAGSGTLTLTDNGRADVLSLVAGQSAGSVGTISINAAAAAAMNVSGAADIGSAGTGLLTIQNGGALTVAGFSTLGLVPGGDGAATVTGAGSAWTAASFTVGEAGEGALTVSSGGLVSTALLNLAANANGAGIVTVTGAGSQLLSTGTQSIGRDGTGTLTVSSGGRVAGDTTAIIGSSTGSDGRATVTGAGSSWTVQSSVIVGNNGSGALTVSSGGEFQGAILTVGSNAGSVGVVTATGAGSILNITSNIVIGNLGTGTLNVETGAEVYAVDLTVGDPAGVAIGTFNLHGGSVFVADDFVRTGNFNFSSGLLQVAGDFQPNAVATTFTLNGTTSADLPTLDLIGSGSTGNITATVIGSNHRGEFRLREGRGFAPGAGGLSLGALPGGNGVLKVESGAVLTTTGTLAVGGTGVSTGGTGVLTIDGGTVDVGTARVFGGGTVHLENGTLAADSLLFFSGSSFHWTTGTVRLDAVTTSVDDLLAARLLGPAKTLQAGQFLSTPGTGGFTMNLNGTMTVDGGTIDAETVNNNATLDLRSGTAAGRTAFNNNGLLLLGGPLAITGATTGFTNNGTIRGSGQILASLTNAVAGRIEVIAGERLFINTSGAPVNSGTISVIGGELQVDDAMTNSASTGFISARDAILRFSGVTNNGAFAFSNGTVDVYGDITQNVGGRITISNGGIANFYDDVVIQPGAASVQATALGATVSRAVFFGSYNGGLTGGGQAFIEGDHRPGNSPALITFGGDVVYGTFANLEMELGGTARGTQYDALNVAGNLAFNGTMTVPLISGFQPAFGNVFNLFDFGSRTGTFTTVNLPALIPGLAWSQASLYTAGEIEVVLDLALASRTWDGGGVNNAWSTDNNWLTDVEPLNNGAASLIFAGNVRLAPSVDTPWNVAAITFDNTAGAFTISGPQAITIGAGGITNNDTQTQMITAAITLSASESFNAAAGDLSISSIALAGQTLAFTGINDVTLATASGSGTINKNNAGDLDITGALGTGGVTLNANAGETNIGANETFTALNIANGATVTLGAIAPAPAFAAVPEPGIGALLLSALGFLGTWRGGFRGAHSSRVLVSASR